MLDLHLQNSVRPRTVSISSSCATGSALKSSLNELHDVFHLSDFLLSESHDVHVLFRILTASYDFLIVQ